MLQTESNKIVNLIVSILSGIGIYFLFLFLLSCRNEVLKIQELTNHFNRCPQEEFDRKLAEILMQLKLIDSYNYYYEINDHLLFVALEQYPRHREFRELCYRTGLKPRLEKNMSVL